MRIGLITYHYGYNEGTLLQAFATQEILRTILGAEVEIIDWRSPAKERIAFSPPANAREQALLTFFKNRLSLSPESFRSQDLDPVFSYIRNRYDLLVVGSDEIWRLDYKVSGFWPFKRYKQKNAWAPAFPNVYFPDPKKAGVPCVSFASSISGSDDILNIPGSHRRQLKRILGGFSCLSVRDSRSSQFVANILQTKDAPCHWVPDPTFWLPPAPAEDRNRFEHRLHAHGIQPNEPIALILSHSKNEEAARSAIAACRRLGYRIVSLSRPNLDADISLYTEDIGPLEWSSAAAFAEVVVTDRFHGAVFAIKSGTPVIALDHRVQSSGAESKIQDFFKRVGIENFWVPVRNDRIANPNSIDDLIQGKDWPSDKVKARTEAFKSALTAFVGGPLSQVRCKS